MIFENPIINGFIFLILGILSIWHHKWWIAKKKKKGIPLDSFDKLFRFAQDWGLTILLLFLSLINFMEGFA